MTETIVTNREPASDAFVKLLETAARRIRQLEADARAALYEAKDEAAYRALLAEKCDLLMELPGQAAELLDRMDDSGPLRARLKSFARRAGQATDLDSVFYKAALLYPDDYKDGDPNELEIWLRELSA
jgi:hypothetical protein